MNINNNKSSEITIFLNMYKQFRDNILFFIFLNIFINLYAQKPNIIFKHINNEDGLSQNTVNCILQDNKGFMWFGTQDGLNRFDGERFEYYKNRPNNPNSLCDNYIQCIYEDENGIFWIGTMNGGLNRFDASINQFNRYNYNSDDSLSISNNMVNCIFKDQLGNLWIGTQNGLNRFDFQTSTFIRYLANPDDPFSLSHNYINTIFEDHSGILWIGTANGLNQYDKKTEKFLFNKTDFQNKKDKNYYSINCISEDNAGNMWLGTNKDLIRRESNTGKMTLYQDIPGNNNSLSGNTVNTICVDHQGRVWIGTDAGGLNLYDRKNDCFYHYKNDEQNPNSISDNNIVSLFQDRSGILWIGTTGYGLNQVCNFSKDFKYYHEFSDVQDSNENITIHAICEDHKGVLWLGVRDALIQYDRNNKRTIASYNYDSLDPKGISKGFIFSIAEDSDNHGNSLWISTFGGGLNCFNRETGIFKHYQNNPNDPHSLSSDYIYFLFIDHRGDLWIGTRKGINCFDRKAEHFKSYQHQQYNQKSLSNDYVYTIFEDHLHQLWLGTGNGLNRFDRKTETFLSYKNNPQDPYSISNNRIYAIAEDQEGALWIGTQGGGLNRFSRDTEKFIYYTEEDGLSNNTIYGILIDNHANFWMSTNRGISKFNPDTEEFENFDVSDGLQNLEFNTNSYFKSKEGEFFFGGIDGFNSFYPDSIEYNTYIPPIVITDFKLFNKSVPISLDSDKKSLLSMSITETEEIKLTYQQNIISFGFAALDFTVPEKNQYAYILKGFEKEWNYVGNNRNANFIGLPPGKYTFSVKGSNNDDVWNQKGTSLKITILPPFWETWWFRTLLIIMICVIAYSWYRMRVRKLERQKQKLEKQVKVRTAEIRNKNKLLEEKNEQIISSIRYGERIQNAILPLTEKIRSSLPEHFILYKPRDIVSGDFYWFNKTDGKTVLAVVDCTGHGVPGAFMSMLGNAFLNEIVTIQKILNPALILKYLHQEIRTALKQEKEQTETQDGMDVCLCVLEKNSHTQKLLFAGAKCSLYIIKKGETELIEIKGDRKSIGGKQREMKREFTGHEFKVQKGDRLYLTTDGFADQQNSKNRRYGSRRLKAFLQSVSELEMQEQEKALAQELARHQGKEEQRDDITVVGVKV